MSVVAGFFFFVILNKTHPQFNRQSQSLGENQSTTRTRGNPTFLLINIGKKKQSTARMQWKTRSAFECNIAQNWHLKIDLTSL